MSEVAALAKGIDSLLAGQKKAEASFTALSSKIDAIKAEMQQFKLVQDGFKKELEGFKEELDGFRKACGPAGPPRGAGGGTPSTVSVDPWSRFTASGGSASDGSAAKRARSEPATRGNELLVVLTGLRHEVSKPLVERVLGAKLDGLGLGQFDLQVPAGGRVIRLLFGNGEDARRAVLLLNKEWQWLEERGTRQRH